MDSEKTYNRGAFNPLDDGAEPIPGRCNCPCKSGRMDTFDWLGGVPPAGKPFDVVEVRFKNTRKGYFHNVHGLNLRKGDLVAVEASPGHDMGIVSLSGDVVRYQLKRMSSHTDPSEMKKVFRKARQSDLEKWLQAVEAEEDTMFRSRKIAERLNLDMKISDVEYQGDKSKAIFYYIAENRVDFRELIKVLAEEFRIRVEMKQIGSRQEAGLVGGIGSCGRELCCSTWMTHFVSVTTGAARHQEVSLNPQKLAGQCGKLKCCLNYELHSYLDAQADFPDVSKPFDTEKGWVYHFKTDIFRRLMWFSHEKNGPSDLVVLSIDKVKEMAQLAKKGIKIKALESTVVETAAAPSVEYQNSVGEESLTRFEDASKRKKRKKKGKSRSSVEAEGIVGQPAQPAQPAQPKPSLQPKQSAQPKQAPTEPVAKRDGGGEPRHNPNPRHTGRSMPGKPHSGHQRPPRPGSKGGPSDNS